ncbi:MAG: SMC-Scp complex subunit ScpB [Thermoplasmata archaeon]|nr:SMC-Scp complex subunit ScpB [Thermoplasmata archaeon]
MGDVELVEAVLFSAGKPISVKDICEATSLEEKTVRSALRKLMRSYETRNTAIDIVNIAHKYSMQLKPDYALETEEVAQKELDREVTKTAVLIAYYQPMHKKELIGIVGEKVRDHVDVLIKMKLIYQNRTNKGYILETAPKFFEFFGLEAKSKEELKQILSKKAGL